MFKTLTLTVALLAATLAAPAHAKVCPTCLVASEAAATFARTAAPLVPMLTTDALEHSFVAR
ncbi:MAG: hypothetical protein FJX02_08755 [Alphaproteobacteria bacterium]|nr:hypothetical protein [Alphaproteobacteria bacterium]